MWPLQKYTQVAYRQNPQKLYVARMRGELTLELDLNSKMLMVKHGFCVMEEVPLLADRLPDVYKKDMRIMFALKEPFTTNVVRKFRVNFNSAADFQSFCDSLCHFVAIRTPSKSSMSCVTPCFSAQKFQQPYDDVSSPVNSAISRNLMVSFALPTPSYSQRTPQTQDSGTSSSRHVPILQSGDSQQDTCSQFSESTQRFLSQLDTDSEPQFRPLLSEFSPVSSQQRFSQHQMEHGSAAQFLNPHASHEFGSAQFGPPASNVLHRTPSQHNPSLTTPSTQIRHEEPFISPPMISSQSQYPPWNSGTQNTTPRAPQSQEYPARDSVSARSFTSATNASLAYSDFVCPTSTSRFDEQVIQGRLTTHPTVAAEGITLHDLQGPASLDCGRDMQRGLSSPGTNTLIDDRRTPHALPSGRAMETPRFDTRHGQPDGHISHSSVERNHYPSWRDRAGQQDQYRPTADSASSALRGAAPCPAVVHTAMSPAGEVSMASSAQISVSRLQGLRQPSMQDRTHVPGRELDRSNISGWLGGHSGTTQTPADDRSEWVVPSVRSEASSEPSCSSAVVTTHGGTSLAPYEQVLTTSPTGILSASGVPIPLEERHLQRSAQAKITNMSSGPTLTSSADTATASAAEDALHVAYDGSSELPRPQPVYHSGSSFFVELPQSPWSAPNDASISGQSSHSSSTVPQSLTTARSKQYSAAGVRSSVPLVAVKREVDQVVWAENAGENRQPSSRNFGAFRGYEQTTYSSLTATIKQEAIDESSLVRPPQHKALLRLQGGKLSSKKTVAGGRQRKPLGEIQGNIQRPSIRAHNKPVKQTDSAPPNGNHSFVRRRKRSSVDQGREQGTQTDSTGGIASLADDPAYVRELLANILQSDYAGRLFQAIDDIITEIDAEVAFWSENVDTPSLRQTVTESGAAHSNDFGDDEDRIPLGALVCTTMPRCATKADRLTFQGSPPSLYRY